MAKKYKVGIFGASGIVGGELIRLIHGHPFFTLQFVHSKTHAGSKVFEVHPYLKQLCDLSFVGEHPQHVSKDVDVIFVALHHQGAAAVISEMGEYSGIMIDLSGAHRLKDTDLYPTVYGFEHPAPTQVSKFVYGLCELEKSGIAAAKRISNPGCFATASILAAAPLVKENIIQESIFVSAITGSSGAGLSMSPVTHHPFRDGNVVGYKIFSHQHEPEIAQSLQCLSDTSPPVILTTHSGPFVRGIHATLQATLKEPVSREKLCSIFQSFYKEAPFVRIRNEPPHLKAVIGSNFCDLFLACRNQDVIVLSVLDNLVKGAAGQAIQNLNIALGMKEEEGLWAIPIYP